MRIQEGQQVEWSEATSQMNIQQRRFGRNARGQYLKGFDQFHDSRRLQMGPAPFQSSIVLQVHGDTAGSRYFFFSLLPVTKPIVRVMGRSVDRGGGRSSPIPAWHLVE